MSDAFLVRRGGGGSFAWDSAIIHIYAPAGSTVTVTNGSTEKTLKENVVVGADSEYIFVVKNADFGTWTITASRNGKASTQIVAVANNVEYLVHIVYELVLYDGSLSTQSLRECTAVTGGWHGTKQGTYYGDGEFHSESNQIRLYRASGRAITAEPLNVIDLTNYSTFKVFVNQQSGNLALRVNATSPVGIDPPRTEITSTGWWTFDISSYTGDYYLGISVWGDGSASTNCFNKVVLE